VAIITWTPCAADGDSPFSSVNDTLLMLSYSQASLLISSENRHGESSRPSRKNTADELRASPISTHICLSRCVLYSSGQMSWVVRINRRDKRWRCVADRYTVCQQRLTKVPDVPVHIVNVEVLVKRHDGPGRQRSSCGFEELP